MLFYSFLFLFPLLTFASEPREYFDFQKETQLFFDHASRNRVLAIDAGGEALWLSPQGQKQSARYDVKDAKCLARQSNGMNNTVILAFPFLVGIQHVCRISEENKSISLVQESSFVQPENAYSVMFLGERGNTTYFLLNGKREIEGGYAMSLEVNAREGSVKLREFLTGVPELSGGMWNHNPQFFITVAYMNGKNDLYELDVKSLLEKVSSGRQEEFLSVAEKKISQFEGLSISLLVSAKEFLFYNWGLESYFLEPNTGNTSAMNLPLECAPIAPWEEGWLVHCEHREGRKGKRSKLWLWPSVKQLSASL